MWSSEVEMTPAVGAMRSDGRTIVNGPIALKTLIVLGAFPVIVHAIFTGMTMLLDVVLASVLEGGWSELLNKGVIVASFLCAVRCSFLVCRRLWPVGLETSESS
jgi:hypothetical protein